MPAATETRDQNLVLELRRREKVEIKTTRKQHNSLKVPKRDTANFTHVFIAVVQATIARYESGDLLAVLDKLHSHALTNSRVWLLGLNTTTKQ